MKGVADAPCGFPIEQSSACSNCICVYHEEGSNPHELRIHRGHERGRKYPPHCNSHSCCFAPPEMMEMVSSWVILPVREQTDRRPYGRPTACRHDAGLLHWRVDRTQTRPREKRSKTGNQRATGGNRKTARQPDTRRHRTTQEKRSETSGNRKKGLERYTQRARQRHNHFPSRTEPGQTQRGPMQRVTERSGDASNGAKAKV